MMPEAVAQSVDPVAEMSPVVTQKIDAPIENADLPAIEEKAADAPSVIAQPIVDVDMEPTEKAPIVEKEEADAVLLDGEPPAKRPRSVEPAAEEVHTVDASTKTNEEDEKVVETPTELAAETSKENTTVAVEVEKDLPTAESVEEKSTDVPSTEEHLTDTPSVTALPTVEPKQTDVESIVEKVLGEVDADSNVEKHVVDTDEGPSANKKVPETEPIADKGVGAANSDPIVGEKVVDAVPDVEPTANRPPSAELAAAWTDVTPVAETPSVAEPTADATATHNDGVTTVVDASKETVAVEVVKENTEKENTENENTTVVEVVKENTEKENMTVVEVEKENTEKENTAVVEVVKDNTEKENTTVVEVEKENTEKGVPMDITDSSTADVVPTADVIEPAKDTVKETVVTNDVEMEVTTDVTAKDTTVTAPSPPVVTIDSSPPPPQLTPTVEQSTPSTTPDVIVLDDDTPATPMAVADSAVAPKERLVSEEDNATSKSTEKETVEKSKAVEDKENTAENVEKSCPVAKAGDIPLTYKSPRVGEKETREYLDSTVVPIMLAAMNSLVTHRPEDPIAYVISYLQANKGEHKTKKTLGEKNSQ